MMGIVCTSDAGVSDGIFMSSRDGLHFDRRFREAFIRPGLDRLNWMHRSNMTAWGLLATAPDAAVTLRSNLDAARTRRRVACRLRR